MPIRIFSANFLRENSSVTKNLLHYLALLSVGYSWWFWVCSSLLFLSPLHRAIHWRVVRLSLGEIGPSTICLSGHFLYLRVISSWRQAWRCKVLWKQARLVLTLFESVWGSGSFIRHWIKTAVFRLEADQLLGQVALSIARVISRILWVNPSPLLVGRPSRQ